MKWSYPKMPIHRLQEVYPPSWSLSEPPCQALHEHNGQAAERGVVLTTAVVSTKGGGKTISTKAV